MPKVTFVLTVQPDPRMKRRMRSFIKYDFHVKLIFAERSGLAELVNDIPRLETQKISIRIEDTDGLIRRLYSLFIFFRHANRAMTIERSDIIYICGFDGLLINFLGNWHKSALIFYEVSDLPGGRWRKKKLLMKLIDWLEGLLIKHTDKIIMTSPYFYPEKYQKYKAETIVLENLPEKRLFDKYQKTEHSDFVVGFFGLVRDKKSIGSLIKALGGISGVRVLIAGSPAMDNEYYKMLEKMGSEYDNVEFKGRYDYEKEILGLYSSIDCVYSVYDKNDENTNLALGNKLYEAIVCCLPIIVTKSSKMADFVEASGIGFAVDPDDPAEIRDTVLKIIKDKAVLKRIEDNCMFIRKDYYYEKKESDFMADAMNKLEKIKDMP